MKVLEEAKKLLEAGWTQEAEARNKDGKPVWADSEEACCFCIIGAVFAAAGRLYESNSEEVEEAFKALDKVKLAISSNDTYLTSKDCIANWNDHPGRKKEEVLEMMEKAAKNE